MSAATATTSSQVLHHTTAFISETLSQPDLRRRIFSTLRQKTAPSSDQNIIRPLNLAAETVENAITTTKVSVRSSSLRLAEKLLNSYPKNPFSSFLLSLIYTLCNCPNDAAICLLDVFYTSPLLARSEIAPQVFEELFLVHFVPVLHWYNDQRSRILSSLPKSSGYDSDDHSICVESVGVSCSTLLSKMNGYQALELKGLERDYEDVLDENCRIFVWYFKEVLDNDDESRLIDPPSVVFEVIDKGEEIEYSDDDEDDEDEQIKADESRMKNGRYNPIWAEEDKSIEIKRSMSKNLSKFPSFFPERVSLKALTSTSSRISVASFKKDSDSESFAEVGYSSSDSEVENEVKDQIIVSVDSTQSPFLKKEQPNLTESYCSPDPAVAEIDNPPGGGKHSAPKDFVCPITSNIFDDPVTLETGQTYERKAIQEWIDRGNSTCPITRQKLNGNCLPKTNYVLKRLIGSWREETETALVQSDYQIMEGESNLSSSVPSASPDSVISQATIDGTVGELRTAIKNLCTSDILKESEVAVLRIEWFWNEANMEVDIQALLSKPAVISGFMEILSNSVDTRVLRATVFLLSEIGSRDDSVIQTLTRVYSDLECIISLFKEGLSEAVVLIYLLRHSAMNLNDVNMVSYLLNVLQKKEDEFVQMCIKPRSASMLLLGQILEDVDDNSISEVVSNLPSETVIRNIVSSLEAEQQEERMVAVSLLLRCMQDDGNCRNLIADTAELAPVLESFLSANDGERFQIIHFLSELVKLNRRTFCEQVLHIIKDEGTFSTMHTFLIYLQTALEDQRPVVAGLLLQLDILVEPRKASIYREEAIDTLISCLKNSEFPAAQIAAAETIMSLQGRFTYSGKPLARAFLLKRAGLEKSYNSLIRKEQLLRTSKESEETMEVEKLAEEWERKMAFVLVSHEFGLLFEALSEGLKSRNAQLSSACFVSSIWLVHMLTILPDTGLRGAARVCLLRRFVSIFKSAKEIEDKALSMLGLSSFIHDPEGLQDLISYVKDILKGLRELKKSSVVAFEMLKVFAEGSDSSNEMWNHEELIQEDCSKNGEVLSIVCLKEKIFSGHSDGTIKMWAGKGSILQLIQEYREHSKAVTSFAVSQSGDRLYSGSLDKTVRAWSFGDEGMHCEQVYDMKDHVNNLVVTNNILYFIPHGAGIKVNSWIGESKLLNSKKYVKCLALAHGKLYCGCQDSSIQEIDLTTGAINTIQSGSRHFISKTNPVYALRVYDGLLYTTNSSLDGDAVKIWSTSNYSMVRTIPSTMEVRSMAISADIIYLGCKGGVVEVWCRNILQRKETLQTGTNGKVLCMALDSDEEILIVGTSDGRIQVWGLS